MVGQDTFGYPASRDNNFRSTYGWNTGLLQMRHLEGQIPDLIAATYSITLGQACVDSANRGKQKAAGVRCSCPRIWYIVLVIQAHTDPEVWHGWARMHTVNALRQIIGEPSKNTCRMAH